MQPKSLKVLDDIRDAAALIVEATHGVVVREIALYVREFARSVTLSQVSQGSPDPRIL